MSARRFFAILAAAIIVVVAALSAARLRQAAPAGAGELLVPQLSAQLGDVTRVTLRKGAAQPATTLEKKDGRWTVAERYGYPADTQKLRRLLQALASARIVEHKSADPANYAQLGVDDPASASALGIEVAITTPAARRVLIVGKAVAGGTIVRRGGEAASLLVAPPVSLAWEPRDWIETHVLDVKAADIRQVSVQDAKGAAVSRDPSAFPALAALSAEDVAPAGSVDFTHAAIATVTLADGRTLTLRGVAAADRRWLEVAPAAGAFAYQLSISSYDAVFKP